MSSFLETLAQNNCIIKRSQYLFIIILRTVNKDYCKDN